MATIIDSLLVTLGLDASNFKQGSEEAGNSLTSMRGQIGEVTDAVGGMALKFAGLVAAAIGIGSIADYLMKVGKSALPLQMMADTLGLDAKGLLILGETSQMFAGSAEDAATSVNNLQQSLFNLKFKGQMSDQLIMLQRLGVQFMTSGGQMRNFNDIAMDTAKALQAAGLDKATKYQYAVSAGFTGGIATAIAEGPAALLKQLGDVTKANKGVTDPMIAHLTQLDRDILLLGDKVHANSIALVDKATPAIEKLRVDIEAIMAWLEKTWKMTTGPNSTLGKTDNFLTNDLGFNKPGGWFSVPSWMPGGSPGTSLTSTGADISAMWKWVTHISEVMASGVSTSGNAMGAAMAPAGASTDIEIGNVNIYTKATDAAGIAATIKPAIKRKFQTAQADSGVTQ